MVASLLVILSCLQGLVHCHLAVSLWQIPMPAANQQDNAFFLRVVVDDFVFVGLQEETKFVEA
jgi:hypothetical protein